MKTQDSAGESPKTAQPTPGAMRAAMMVRAANPMVGSRASLDEAAAIIDRETAAPELLEALRGILANEYVMGVTGFLVEFETARAAIAKAEGRT